MVRNYKISFFLILACSLLSACSTLDSLLSQTLEKRSFQVQPVWVQQTTKTENLLYRKINRMTPVFAGDLIIQGNSLDGLVAYDRENFSEKWRLPIVNGIEGGAALIRDRLFFGASDGHFYSVSAKTGQVYWSFAAKAENLTEPFINSAEGIVYFLSSNSIVYALEADSGKQLWIYSRQDTSSFHIRGGAKPILKDDTLYVGFSDGAIVALTAKTGSTKWELQLNKNKKFRDINTTPVIDQDRMYVAGYDDRLYCISISKGEILWKVDGGGYNSLTLSGDRLLYPTTTGEVWALKRNSGEKIWTYKLNEGIATSVKTMKGLAVFGESQGKLRFLDLNTGKEVGSFEPGKGILATPLIDEKKNRVYFISGEANIYAVEAGWSRPKWIPYLE